MGVQVVDKADLWKSARLLKLRVRDRFRVVVANHRARAAMFSPQGYFSSTVQRWVTRFQNFRRESLASPPAFYRKRVSKDLSMEEESALFRMLQAVAVPLIGNACHVFMNGLNRVQVHGLEKLHDALLNRPKNKPLVTVSNHVASVDDPFIIASLLPPRVLLDARKLRWTLCASDRCFKNPVTSAFFQSVKVLPVSRGDGIYQQGMDMAISKLNSGGWVHIFPEGSRSRDGGKTIGSAKRGVGRLILDADTLPMVVPFVHTGMQEIMPIGANIPRIGKSVTVVIGDPIRFDDLLNTEGAKHVSRKQLYDAVSSRIGQRLYELKLEVDKMALRQQSMRLQDAGMSSAHASKIIDQVDWDSFGMGTQYMCDSSTHESFNQRDINQVEDLVPNQQNQRVGLWYEGGVAARVKRYLDSTELVGFAARGLFLNSQKVKEDSDRVGKRGALKAWNKYFEASLLKQWNPC